MHVLIDRLAGLIGGKCIRIIVFMLISVELEVYNRLFAYIGCSMITMIHFRLLVFEILRYKLVSVLRPAAEG